MSQNLPPIGKPIEREIYFMENKMMVQHWQWVSVFQIDQGEVAFVDQDGHPSSIDLDRFRWRELAGEG